MQIYLKHSRIKIHSEANSQFRYRLEDMYRKDYGLERFLLYGYDTRYDTILDVVFVIHAFELNTTVCPFMLYLVLDVETL